MNLCFTRAYKCILVLYIGFAAQQSFAQQTNKDKTVLAEVHNPVDNSLKSLTFSENASWKQDQAQEIFSRYLHVVNGGPISMVLKNATATKSNITTQRFEEYYKGIKVAHGGFTLTGMGDKVSFMTGNFYSPASELNSTPSLTSTEAFAKAMAFVGASKYKWQNPIEEEHIRSRYHNPDTSYLPVAKLLWVEDLRSNTKDHKLHLAYSFDIYAEEPLSRQDVFIDAITGKVLFANQLLKHTAATGASRYSGTVPFVTSFTTGTYILFDSTRGDGVYTQNMLNGTSYGAAIDFASATNTWPTAPVDNVAIDAQWGAEMVYDYWLTQHARLSWDGLNSILMQYIHYGTNYNNAFWNGSEMTYGDGSGIAAGGFTPLMSLDVTAHEIGHGVCQATCNLIYEKESGALNEAFSDCWGATIEHWADPHESDAMPKAYWEIGEEISTEPLRSINTPILQGQPDTYSGTNWFNVVGCTPTSGNDNCGVHRNSGLMNYWYFLLTMGGSGVNDNSDSYVVNPLGWTKAAQILYGTELALGSTDEYMDARIASINIANVLYGPCSPEAQSVTSAWYAVGVGPDYVACAPQISFVQTSVRVSEKVATATCPASKTINIGLKPTGAPVIGGNPVANIVVASTDAVYGVDYTLSSTSVTFPAGSTATRFFTVTVFDNGAVNDNKHIDFAFTVNPMGTGATIAPFNDSMTLYIDNDDSVPHLGATIYPTLNEGIPVTSDFTTPFYGTQRRARSQFILYASELASAGVVPGVPITQLGLNLITKGSTAPFLNFAISMANTSNTDLYSSFVTAGLSLVYNGDYTTTLGANAIDFNAGTFTWDGVSNVVVQFCYGMLPAAFSSRDKVAGVQQGLYIIGDYNTSNTGSGTGCGLGFNNGNRVVIRPVMTFKQDVPPAPIETVAASNRVWDIHAAQEVYFYNPADGDLIAGVKDMDNDLGCVSATITQAGNGVAPAVFSAINRSLKEINVVPSINGAITTYDITMYLNNSELAGIVPSTLFLLKTTSPTDAGISNANSVVLTPTLIAGGDYTGFRATSTGFGRYMLVDGPLCNKPAASITPAGPTTFCVGGNVLLDAPTGPGLSYQWLKDGISISGATDANFTATLGGDYVVTVNESVCDSTSLPVTITLDSAFTAPITGATQACTGQTTPLMDITGGGIWSSSNTAIATVSGAGIVTGVSLGTVTITYTVTNPCGTASATYAMTVNGPSAVAPITGLGTVCQAAAIALADATPGGTWISGATAIATVGTSGIVTGVAAGAAPISYASANAMGCIAYAITTVTVNSTPIATTSPTGPVVICLASTLTINAAPPTGHTYQWQSSGVAIPGQTNATFTSGTPGNYNVAITNPLGCTGTSATVNLSVSATATVVPSVTLSSSAGLEFCESAALVTYTAIPVNGGVMPLYQWSVNGVPTGGTGNTFAYTPANGDVVGCQLTSSAPCAVPATVSSSLTMTVNPYASPTVVVMASPNDTVCTDDFVTYSALTMWAGTAPEYLWTENGINVATGPTYTIQPLNGDVIICHITSNYPCLLTGTATSAPFTMRVQVPVTNPVAVTATPAVAAPGSPITFTAIAPNSGTSAGYQWYVNGVAVAGATNVTYTTGSLLMGQIVNCKVTSSLICVSPRTSMSGGYTVKFTTGLEGINAGNKGITLQPNPSAGTFTINSEGGFVAGEQVAITVFNVLGQKVYGQNEITNSSRFSVMVSLPNTLASGMYLVRVVSESQQAVFNMSLQK